MSEGCELRNTVYAMVEPLLVRVGKLAQETVMLRVMYEIGIATDNGAKLEDLGEIIAGAVEACTDDLKKALDEISRVKEVTAAVEEYDARQRK